MPSSFYDDLAPDYHLLYGNWEHAVSEQGAALATLLAAEGVTRGMPVLDAACGIGTQTLGLLAQGYLVSASDISTGAVGRLRAELVRRGLSATVHVDDLRTLERTADDTMAAVLACDNSLAHLLTEADLLQALRSSLRCLRAGGVLVVSVRDYAAIERKSPDVRPYGLRMNAQGHRFLAVQVWEWDGDQYELRLYLTEELPDGSCATRVLKSRCKAVTTVRVEQLMVQAGFSDVRRMDQVLFQPTLVGRKPHRE